MIEAGLKTSINAKMTSQKVQNKTDKTLAFEKLIRGVLGDNPTKQELSKTVSKENLTEVSKWKRTSVNHLHNVQATMDSGGNPVVIEDRVKQSDERTTIMQLENELIGIIENKNISFDFDILKSPLETTEEHVNGQEIKGSNMAHLVSIIVDSVKNGGDSSLDLSNEGTNKSSTLSSSADQLGYNTNTTIIPSVNTHHTSAGTGLEKLKSVEEMNVIRNMVEPWTPIVNKRMVEKPLNYLEHEMAIESTEHLKNTKAPEFTQNTLGMSSELSSLLKQIDSKLHASMSEIEQFVVHLNETDASNGTSLQSKLVEQIQNVLQTSRFLNSTSSSNQLVLNLSPEHFGEITVDKTQMNGDITIKMVPSSQATKDMLEASKSKFSHVFSSLMSKEHDSVSITIESYNTEKATKGAKLIQPFQEKSELTQTIEQAGDGEDHRLNFGEWAKSSNQSRIGGSVDTQLHAPMSKIEQFVVHVNQNTAGDSVSSQSEIAEEIEKAIKTSKFLNNTTGPKQLMLKLKPENLGDIMVKMTQVNGEMIVKMVVTSQMTRDVLEANVNQLRHMFSPQQVIIEKQDVQLFQQEQQQPGQQRASDQSNSDQPEQHSDEQQDKQQQAQENSESFYDVLMNEKV